MRYPVTLTRDANDTILATFPDVPEAITWGDTPKKALRHAVDALATVIEAFMKDRRDIPEPSTTGRYFVELPPLMSAKVDLYRTMRESNVGKADLGKRLGWHLPQVDRLLAMRHGSQLDQLDRAFGALGKRIVVSIEDKAPEETYRVTRSRGTLARKRPKTA